MYRTIVARKVRSTFAGLSAGDSAALTSQLADAFVYHFRGDHALGGTRTSLEAMALWFDRVYRLLPGLHFDVQDVAVSGAPWRTVVLTRVVVTADDDYRNEIFQTLRIRWGRLTEIITLEDTQVLEARLEKLADAGHDEALAAPIEG